jgi:hypothetical protein
MSNEETAEPKKAPESAKVEITDLDSESDPKAGLNFEEVKTTVQPPAGTSDPLKWSWGMAQSGTLNK